MYNFICKFDDIFSRFVVSINLELELSTTDPKALEFADGQLKVSLG